MSQNGNIVEANRIELATLGYSREELLRMSPRDIDAPTFKEQFSHGTRFEHQMNKQVVVDRSHDFFTYLIAFLQASQTGQ